MVIIGRVIPGEISFDFDVHKIRPSFLHGLFTAVQCTGEISRVLNAFPFDPVTGCELDIVDVRVTQVCAYIPAGLMTFPFAGNHRHSNGLIFCIVKDNKADRGFIS